MRFRLVLTLLLVLSLIAAACGDDDDATTNASGESCAIADLNLLEAGVLTVATSEPSFPPWVGLLDGTNFDDPTSKTGFESAMVYEIAERMGFADTDVKWVRIGFFEAISVGPKDFDFNVQQYSISADRDEVVDFSVPYYTTTQALVTLADSPYANASSIADLKGAKLGAQIATTNLDFIEDVIQPDTQPNVYDGTDAAGAAMNAGQIEGMVVDLPTAYFVTGAQVENSVIAGKFEAQAAAPDSYGLLFAEGNSLVACVNAVIDDMRSDGTLAGFVETYLEDGGEINVITG